MSKDVILKKWTMFKVWEEVVPIYKKNAETEKRKADKKQKVYDVSMELFLEKGYYNTSVRDIVSKLDISIGTFYNYFTNKEELFIEIYENFASKIFRVNRKATETYIENPLVYVIRSISVTLLMYKKYRKEAIMLRVKEVGSNKLFEEKVAQFTEYSYSGTEKMLERFQENSNLKIEDIKKTAICYVSSINGMILYMLTNDIEHRISELAIPLISYNLNALGFDFDKKMIEEIYTELQKEFDSDVLFG